MFFRLFYQRRQSKRPKDTQHEHTMATATVQQVLGISDEGKNRQDRTRGHHGLLVIVATVLKFRYGQTVVASSPLVVQFCLCLFIFLHFKHNHKKLCLSLCFILSSCYHDLLSFIRYHQRVLKQKKQRSSTIRRLWRQIERSSTDNLDKHFFLLFSLIFSCQFGLRIWRCLFC